jgi:hypothetical protein
VNRAFAIGLAVLPAHDGAQGGVGLHGRAVDADALAFDQPLLGNELQDPAEDLLVGLEREAASGFRQPGVIGNPLTGAQAEKVA